MANSTQGFPAHAQQQQPHADLARAKQQQQPPTGGTAATNAPNATELQQRAAAAAQLFTAERKYTSRDIHGMLEKNDAALRGWNALHTQEPPKTLVKEHKEWVRKCLLYRQQVGERLELLASLADKQIATEDEKVTKPTTKTTPKTTPKAPKAAKITAKTKLTKASAATTIVQTTAAKKSKASAALARQAAAQAKAAAAAVAAIAKTQATQNTTTTTIRSNCNSNSSTLLPPSLLTTGTTATVPLAAPTTFPELPPTTSFSELPMPSQVTPQQPFGYAPVATGADTAFFSTQQQSQQSGGIAAPVNNFSDLSMLNAFPLAAAASYNNSANAFGSTIPNDPLTAAFLAQQSQQTPNYMMNPMAMLNPQYLAAMQLQMPGGAMGMADMSIHNNSMFSGGGPTMFNSYGANDLNGSLNTTHQLPADPFNTSFGQSAFMNPLVSGSASGGGFDAMHSMNSMQAAAAMMHPMNAFSMLPDPMLMNAFPYSSMNMAPVAPQTQQNALPFPVAAAGGGASDASSQAFAGLPSSSALPTTTVTATTGGQQQQQQQSSVGSVGSVGSNSDHPTIVAPAAGDAFADSSSLFDDAMASSLFDGFPDDAFLQM